MITLGGQILQSDDSGNARLRSGVVEIEGERIVGVHFEQVSSAVDAGDAETLICPGLIDTHLHLPQFDSIGASGMRLLDWLTQVIFPAEASWNDQDKAEEMIRRVARQCLAFGTTGIGAYATVSCQATGAALAYFEDLGFRGVIGQVLMDEGASPELLRPREQLLEEAAAALEAFPPDGRLAAAVTPRFALACSFELLQQSAGLAEQRGAIIQTHLAETVAECEAVRERFSGRRYVEVYSDAGMLGPNSIFGHGIHLSTDDRRRIAASGSVIAHCPTANAFLGSGTMDLHVHRSFGIPIALGSDVGAGFERSMVRVGRSMIQTAMRAAAARGEPDDGRTTVPTAAQAWHQITAGNADAMGWGDVGRIEVGKSADLLVVRPDLPWQESADPLSALMFAWDDRWIEQTILRGRLRYRADSGGR